MRVFTEASFTRLKASSALQKIKFLMFHVLVVSMLGWLSAVDTAADERETVLTFLKVYCADCHGQTNPHAGLRLDNLSADFADPIRVDDVLVDAWQRVHEQITLGVMPPVESSQLPAGEAGQVTDWITSQLRVVGQTPAVWHKLDSPQFGNYVSHERLFDGSQQGAGFSPPRLWRLSPYVYDEFVNGFGRHLREVTAIHQPFPLDASRGEIADFSAQQVAGEATLQLLMMNCRTLAEYQTTGVAFRDHEAKHRKARRTPAEFDVILESQALPTDEVLRAAIAFEFDLLLERAPTQQEYESLTDFFSKAAVAGGNVKALQTTLQAILMKPEAVYRMEIGFGALDDDGRRRLSPAELAFAIARALTDTGPSEIEVVARDGETKTTLLNLALSGELDNPADIQRIALQILDNNNMSTADYRMFTQDHGIRNTRTLRFFREFFGYHHAPNVFKDAKRIGFGDRYLTKRMVDDADQLVMHIFDQDRDVLKRLLTTDEYFVAYLGSLENIQKDLHYIKTNKNDANFEFNTKYVQLAESEGRHPIPIEGPSSRQYVDFYNLNHATWDYPTRQPFKMPDGQRAGILTHPAWLIAWSGNFDTDPIRRGKWIREHLLADTMPDIPLDVNAVVSEDRSQSLRQRLQVTREEYCWKCHQKMDPLGLPFEQFDDFGRYREDELVGELLTIFPERHNDALTVPLDTRGGITDSGDPDLDGGIVNVFELVKRLGNSSRVRQSFVRHAFRFWLGRNETLDDSTTLIQADQAYVKHGGSMKAMIASLLSSDSFLYRKAK
ncbi:DUF1588 domain-containing protein [Rubripirellula sp.]|nr:DUF1588 domain-containing protein [Rubripirellula sp.]MDB4749596.1 DUF1588 domain-containing protein [Rubripirellula sp.]